MNIGKIHAIPLNQTTAYLAGVIVGDGSITGHSPKYPKKYCVSVELVDKEYLELVATKLRSLVSTRSVVRDVKSSKRKRPAYVFSLNNKSFYYFMISDLGIPAGKKSSSVCIPNQIFCDMVLLRAFIGGLFDTDGGFRGSSIGFTSASSQLISQLSTALSCFGIEHSTGSWMHKAYAKQYFGIKIRKKCIDTFLNEFQILNNVKRKRILARFPRTC